MFILGIGNDMVLRLGLGLVKSAAIWCGSNCMTCLLVIIMILCAGDDAVGVQWMDMSRHVKLYASHNSLIREVIERLKAHW